MLSSLLRHLRRTPVLQQRYNFIAAAALQDAQAGWTQEERAAIVAHMSDEDEDEDVDTRTIKLNFRVSADENGRLRERAAAAAADMSVSEYIRARTLED